MILSGKRLLVYLLLFLPIYLFVLHSYKEQLCAAFVSIDCPLQFDLCGCFSWYFSTFHGIGIRLTKDFQCLFIVCTSLHRLALWS